MGEMNWVTNFTSALKIQKSTSGMDTLIGFSGLFNLQIINIMRW